MTCAVRALLESVEFTRCFSVLNWLYLVKILILTRANPNGPSVMMMVGAATAVVMVTTDERTRRAKPRDGDGHRRGYGRLGSDGRRALRGRKRTGKGTTRVAGATGTGNARARVR